MPAPPAPRWAFVPALASVDARLRFCRWHDVERLVALPATDEASGTIH